MHRSSMSAAAGLGLLCAACASTSAETRPTSPSRPAAGSALGPLAERYVKLVLALGQHDANDVDAYYGPKEWAEAAKARKVPLPELQQQGEALLSDLRAAPAGGDEVARRSYLSRQLAALLARVRMLRGEKLSFDEESQALYDARSPRFTEEELAARVKALDAALPGEGPLADRLDAYRKRFELPKDRLDPVFRAAIAEARRRTLAHVKLPEGETFALEYVTGKPWGGYNWYQGNARSLIQINTDLPIYPWRAVDLAAHEGYPGHHVYNALLEQHLVKDRGWVEFTVYPLFSPQSLIAEGSANYGIEVAFPDAAAFTRDVLFPLAGFDPKDAVEYVRIEDLTEGLSWAGNEVAGRYLDGTLTRDQARDWLVKYAVRTTERAEKRLDFVDTYRSYVVTYGVGKDLVRQYVEKRAGDDPQKRWGVFLDLLASPGLPSDLR